jgi:hypothetical protein
VCGGDVVVAVQGAFMKQLGWIAEAAAAGLYQTANQIKNTAEELVPVDTATLKGSARVLPPEVDGDEIICIVGFGYGETLNPKSDEPASGYAFWVEQREDVVHPHGQAHFLRDAALRHMPGLGADVAVSIQVLRKAGFLRRVFTGDSYHVTTETISE